jgi:uncharacterized protein
VATRIVATRNYAYNGSVPDNPFNFGDLALDDVFTDRESELAELTADIRNGQNVVVFAPRRFGKSSLVWRASRELLAADEALIAQVDLMRTPTKELLAARLAEAIYDQIATPLMRVRERAANVFRGLRVSPSITVDPEDGRVRFGFSAGLAPADVDATLERLLELPAELAAERGGRRVALVFDEFQEVIDLDPRLPALMRSVFQTQPHVAHVYLGSKRSLMERLFNDVNEPFWRSARQMELGPIAPESFSPFIHERFASTGRAVDEETVAQVLQTTGGHPYATQELCYSLWEATADNGTADTSTFAVALDRVLRSEQARFTLVWDEASGVQRLVLQALAAEPANAITAAEYRRRHNLPGSSSVQRALDVLVADELIVRLGPGAYRISEPFLAEWVRRFAA